jgi:cyclase
LLRTRVIPCLLLQERRLVKTVQFNQPRYVGDPVNVVRIFNEKEVDELIVLDISRTPKNASIDFDLVQEIASECFMPVAYGGGIKTISDINRLFSLGVEKVVLNTAALDQPNLVKIAATTFGSQSVVVAVDVKKDWLGRYRVLGRCGKQATGWEPVRYVQEVQAAGAGEILINSIDRDGTMQGYDLALVRAVCDAVSVPVIACGGAGRLEDFVVAVRDGHASAVAAGSMFVFHGKHRAVLVSYPEYKELERLL